MTSKLATRLALLCAAVPCSAAVQTQDNMQKLEGLKSTGASLNTETVPQGRARVAALKANLKQVELSPGFKIDLYAIVPDTCHIVVSPNTGVIFVGTHKTRVRAISDHTGNHIADEVKVFAPSVSFRIPNSLRFPPDGVLYIAEQNHVLALPAADSSYESPDVATAPVMPRGELIPVEGESSNHTVRTCRVGPDGKLYIILGNPFNVPPKEKVTPYDKVGMMDIIRVDHDGEYREVSARGVRSSARMGSNPKDKTLWSTDNQTDRVGDDIPSGELNRATKADENFGFSWYGGGHIRTVECRSGTPPFGVAFPQVEMAVHAADLGITFCKDKMFPAKYQGGISGAQHGSWSRIAPVGAHIMYTPVKADGTTGKTKVFAEGWLTSNDKYLGRPIDVATLLDGSLLISDDYTGIIYRVSYAAE